MAGRVNRRPRLDMIISSPLVGTDRHLPAAGNGGVSSSQKASVLDNHWPGIRFSAAMPPAFSFGAVDKGPPIIHDRQIEARPSSSGWSFISRASEWTDRHDVAWLFGDRRRRVLFNSGNGDADDDGDRPRGVLSNIDVHRRVGSRPSLWISRAVRQPARDRIAPGTHFGGRSTRSLTFRADAGVKDHFQIGRREGEKRKPSAPRGHSTRFENVAAGSGITASGTSRVCAHQANKRDSSISGPSIRTGVCRPKKR